MNCQDFRELIDSYLCDELLTETNHGVLRHLERCSDCRSVTEDRRVFRARLRSTVVNCEDFKICDKFNSNLHVSLRQSVLSKQNVQAFFLFRQFCIRGGCGELFDRCRFWNLVCSNSKFEFVG